MSVAEVNGQRISFQDSGGDGPVIVFSHGFLMDGSMFDDQVAGLRDQFRCITWDERGHGGTLANGPFTYWDSADRRTGAARPPGHLPGRLLWHVPGRLHLPAGRPAAAPERVRGLVLIDTQSGLEDPEALPLYTALHDEWVANGPAAVQEMVAALIFGPGIDIDPWYAKWGALDRTLFTQPVPHPGRSGRADRPPGRDQRSPP